MYDYTRKKYKPLVGPENQSFIWLGKLVRFLNEDFAVIGWEFEEGKDFGLG
jgi:hypothetical protein